MKLFSLILPATLLGLSACALWPTPTATPQQLLSNVAAFAQPTHDARFEALIAQLDAAGLAYTVEEFTGRRATPGRNVVVRTGPATGKQILRFNADGEFHSSWNAAQLGISCASTLGVQSLPNKNLLLACGDYHIDSPAAARDVLVEINTAGTVVWRLTHDQLASQIEGTKDSKTGHEHLHVANVHFYDTDDPAGVLAVFR